MVLLTLGLVRLHLGRAMSVSVVPRVVVLHFFNNVTHRCMIVVTMIWRYYGVYESATHTHHLRIRITITITITTIKLLYATPILYVWNGRAIIYSIQEYRVILFLLPVVVKSCLVLMTALLLLLPLPCSVSLLPSVEVSVSAVFLSCSCDHVSP